MHVILICISVIIQLYSVLSVRRIRDFTELCTSNGSLDYYLTQGLGSFDGLTCIISTEKPINCRLHVRIMNDNYVLTVVEIPDWNFQRKLCFQENISALTVSTYENQSCSAVTPGPRHSSLAKTILHFAMDNISTVNTFKLIFTAMRDPGLYNCRRQEVKCVFKRKIFCINGEFMCDGDDNCGVPDNYDENYATCKGFGVTYFMVFCSIIMCALSLLLLALLFLSFSPKRKETFSYRFDNSLPLFDSETGVINYEIDIKVLFPPTSKSVQSTKSILLNK